VTAQVGEELTVRAAVLAALAAVQAELLAEAGHLLSLGCWDRRPERLAAVVPDLADRSDLFGPLLTAAESVRLAARWPRVVAACHRLAAAPPGPTLLHGDLHPGNWAAGRGGVVLFDWAEASVGHPFLDVAPALRSLPDPAARRAATTAYLDRWAPWLPDGAGRPTWRLAEPVAALNKLLTYVSLHDQSPAADRPGWLPRIRWWARCLLAADLPDPR
jgi:hypothetical protein